MSRRKFLAGGAAGLTAVAGSGLITSAPAIAQERIKLTVASTWPRDFPGLGTSAQRLVERISELSEGRIETEYFAAGERVGAFDVFDAAASGDIQAYIGADYYWKGKHPALSYFTAVPMGLTTNEWSAWIKFQDGQDLWDEVSGEFGIKALPCGSTGCQMGGWFNKEIETADDLKGLKMRIPGLGGDVMAKLGASPVSLPGGQIYENLVSGAIDATEWVGPYNDYFMKFYEAAKYYYAAGIHEPGSSLAFGMNKEWWEKLSSYDQALITACCYEEHANQYDEATARNGEYLAKMIDENGVELRYFSDEVYDSFNEAADEVFEETRDHSELAAKVHDSFLKARSDLGTWMKNASVGYSNQRNRILDL